MGDPTEVIAYTWDADYHCVECTEAAHPGSTDWRRDDFDPADYLDSEGNEIHAVFGDAEWWESYESFPQVLYCSDCGGLIDEVL